MFLLSQVSINTLWLNIMGIVHNQQLKPWRKFKGEHKKRLQQQHGAGSKKTQMASGVRPTAV